MNWKVEFLIIRLLQHTVCLICIKNGTPWQVITALYFCISTCFFYSPSFLDYNLCFSFLPALFLRSHVWMVKVSRHSALMCVGGFRKSKDQDSSGPLVTCWSWELNPVRVEEVRAQHGAHQWVRNLISSVWLPQSTDVNTAAVWKLSHSGGQQAPCLSLLSL